MEAIDDPGGVADPGQGSTGSHGPHSAIRHYGRPERQPRPSRVVASIVGAIMLVVSFAFAKPPGVTVAASYQAPDSELASVIERRAALGLSTERNGLESLIGTAKDVGSEAWGLPMTAAEAARVDFPGRMAFAYTVGEQVLPKVSSLPTFAAAYFDAAGNGELVVALTAIDTETIAGIRSLMPTGSRGLRIVQRAVTDAALRDAMGPASNLWVQLIPGVRLNATELDTVDGRLKFLVDYSDVEVAARRFSDLASAFNVPMILVGAEPPMDTACTSRDNCVSPMKAGVRLYKGVIDSHNECTMAFRVWLNNLDQQFLTAGHCGYSGSNNWLHPGLPGNHIVGTDQATLYGPEGYDIMRIQMPDTQAGSGIYADARLVRGAAYPTSGMPVCTSRGYTNAFNCGTVTSASARWFSDTASYYVWGGDTDLPAQGGDSGSPIYFRSNVSDAYAVGTLANTFGNFAFVNDALSLLGPLAIYAP